jgi:hypothetical protein
MMLTKMTFSKEANDFYSEKVRMVMVLRGNNVSCRDIADILSKQKSPIKISYEYANKLKNKILREMDYRARYYAYSTAIPDLENTLMETIKQAWAVAMSQETSPSAKIQALKEVRDAKQQLIDNLLKTGKLNKVPDKIAIYKHEEHEVKIPPEVLAAIECIETQMSAGPEPVQYIDTKPKELPAEKAKKDEPKPESKQAVQFPGGTLTSEPDLP